jgi:hypothetical protein
MVLRARWYTAFESSFPVADGWMAFCMLVSGIGFVLQRRFAAPDQFAASRDCYRSPVLAGQAEYVRAAEFNLDSQEQAVLVTPVGYTTPPD